MSLPADQAQAVVAQQKHLNEQMPAVPELRNSPQHLIELAIQQPDFDVTKLEKLMDMQERWEQAQAAKEYAIAFAAYQAECPPVPKDQKVAAHQSRYAPIDVLVAHCAPYLTKHGFSHRFEFTDTAEEMRVTCVLQHANGHCERNSMSGPPDSGKAMNALQGRASSNSYLSRYTFVGVTGITVQGEDSDGGKPRVVLSELLRDNEIIQRHFKSIAWACYYADSEQWEACVECFYEIPDEERRALGRARTKGGLLNDEYKQAFLSDEFKAAKLALGISDAGGETVRQ